MAPPASQQSVDYLVRREALGVSDAGLFSERHVLWLALCERLARNELVAYGKRSGSATAKRIPNEFLCDPGLQLDFTKSRIELDGVIYNGVLIFETAMMPAACKESVAPSAGGAVEGVPAGPAAAPGRKSGHAVDDFVVNYVAEMLKQNSAPTQIGLLKAWKDDGQRGRRPQLLAALHREAGEPVRGRPPRTRPN